MDSTESPNKTLTHKFSTKYDLHFLKQVQGIENQLIESLAKVYNLEDPDDIPLDIDIQGICLNPEIADKVAAFVSFPIIFQIFDMIL